MSELLRQQLLERIQEVYGLLKEVQQYMIVTSNPLEYARFALDEKHLRYEIKRLENIHDEIEAGVRVIQNEDASLRPKITVFPPNPFDHTGAVADQWFVGREVMLQSIKDSLHKNRSVMIIGPKGVGKSSLLQRILEQYEAEQRNYFYLDLKSGQSLEEYYTEITDKLGRSGNSIKDVRNAIKGKQFALFVDDFDLAPALGLNVEHFYVFRSLAQDKNSEFQMVVVTNKEASKLYPGPFDLSDPYVFLFKKRLGVFDPAEAEKLFEAYLDQYATLFKPEERKKLIDLSGRHPYKLQKAAYYYYEYLRNQDMGYKWRTEYDLDIAGIEK